jgi:dipeptidyl aminopeptidase/acylaminoacyl peptidase
MTLRLALLAVAPLTALAPASAEAAFPGRNGLVAHYQADVGGLEEHGISVAPLGGGAWAGPYGPSCAEGDPDPCPLRPAWSADGRRLAFDLEGRRLGVMDADGSNVRILSFPGVAAARPAWSPDGTRLVFQGRAGGVLRLYVAAADGSGLRRLTRGAQPAWSARGVIAFVRGGRLYRIRPDGRGLRRLTGAPASEPDWSPDSRQLVFVRRGRAFRMALGGRPRRVTRRRANGPVWTPDGRWIVFDRGDGGYRAIYRIRPRGGRPRLVTSGNEGRRMQVLQPDVQPLAR